jgi:FlaA1/EpsC-like NDP-sugar epimerase
MACACWGPSTASVQVRDFAGGAHAIVAMPGTSAAVRRRAMELAAAGGLGVLTVPAFSDLLSGKFAISQVRAVELEDLLGRDR